MTGRSTTFAVRDRCRNEMNELFRTGADPMELLDEVLARLRAHIDFDAAFISATDPTTTLFAQAGIVEQLPPTMCAPWLDNEFAAEDFNKYADLHRAGSGPTTLHRSTFGRPERSVRHRELNTAYGYGPELRAAFSVDGECWGAINLLRDASAEDFGDDDLALVDAIGQPVAKGLRRFVLGVHTDRELHEGLGVVLLDDRGAVVSMTEHARTYLSELSHPGVEHRGTTLPGEAYVVGARARARAAGLPGPAPVVRTRARSGQWLTLRADCSRDTAGAVVSTAIVIEPSRSSEMLPLFVAAHGLSPREESVLAELAKGATTAETARALEISPHTVRDHVKSLHEKVGVRSRAELVSELYCLQYAPDFTVAHRS
jgi:DNA-binding CsgD family transcriptional regulator